MMVAALMIASTCGSSRMTFMAASTVVGHHLHHEADIDRRGHRREDDEDDPVASLHIWVRVCHFAIVGRPPVRASLAENCRRAVRFKRVPAAGPQRASPRTGRTSRELRSRTGPSPPY